MAIETIKNIIDFFDNSERNGGEIEIDKKIKNFGPLEFFSNKFNCLCSYNVNMDSFHQD